MGTTTIATRSSARLASRGALGAADTHAIKTDGVLVDDDLRAVSNGSASRRVPNVNGAAHDAGDSSPARFVNCNADFGDLDEAAADVNGGGQLVASVRVEDANQDCAGVPADRSDAQPARDEPARCDDDYAATDVDEDDAAAAPAAGDGSPAAQTARDAWAQQTARLAVADDDDATDPDCSRDGELTAAALPQADCVAVQPGSPLDACAGDRLAAPSTSLAATDVDVTSEEDAVQNSGARSGGVDAAVSREPDALCDGAAVGAPAATPQERETDYADDYDFGVKHERTAPADGPEGMDVDAAEAALDAPAPRPTARAEPPQAPVLARENVEGCNQEEDHQDSTKQTDAPAASPAATVVKHEAGGPRADELHPSGDPPAAQCDGDDAKAAVDGGHGAQQRVDQAQRSAGDTAAEDAGDAKDGVDRGGAAATAKSGAAPRSVQSSPVKLESAAGGAGSGERHTKRKLIEFVPPPETGSPGPLLPDKKAASVDRKPERSEERDAVRGRDAERARGREKGLFDHLKSAQSTQRSGDAAGGSEAARRKYTPIPAPDLASSHYEDYDGPDIRVTSAYWQILKQHPTLNHVPDAFRGRSAVYESSPSKRGLKVKNLREFLPPPEARGALRFAHATPRFRHPVRRVNFTGDGLVQDATYRSHGNALSVVLEGSGSRYWYLDLLKRRFIVDPCEWDVEYKTGVEKIERLLRDPAEKWDLRWVMDRTDRRARATAVRKFGKDRLAHVPVGQTFAHFQDICRREPKLEVRGNNERDFEVGCARLSGLVSPETFQMLCQLPQGPMYTALVAFGRETCDSWFDPDPRSVKAEERLRALCVRVCTNKLFTRVVCKHGMLLPDTVAPPPSPAAAAQRPRATGGATPEADVIVEAPATAAPPDAYAARVDKAYPRGEPRRGRDERPPSNGATPHGSFPAPAYHDLPPAADFRQPRQYAREWDPQLARLPAADEYAARGPPAHHTRALSPPVAASGKRAREELGYVEHSKRARELPPDVAPFDSRQYADPRAPGGVMDASRHAAPPPPRGSIPLARGERADEYPPRARLPGAPPSYRGAGGEDPGLLPLRPHPAARREAPELLPPAPVDRREYEELAYREDLYRRERAGYLPPAPGLPVHAYEAPVIRAPEALRHPDDRLVAASRASPAFLDPRDAEFLGHAPALRAVQPGAYPPRRLREDEVERYVDKRPRLDDRDALELSHLRYAAPRDVADRRGELRPSDGARRVDDYRDERGMLLDRGAPPPPLQRGRGDVYDDPRYAAPPPPARGRPGVAAPERGNRGAYDSLRGDDGLDRRPRGDGAPLRDPYSRHDPPPPDVRAPVARYPPPPDVEVYAPPGPAAPGRDALREELWPERHDALYPSRPPPRELPVARDPYQPPPADDYAPYPPRYVEPSFGRDCMPVDPPRRADVNDRYLPPPAAPLPPRAAARRPPSPARAPFDRYADAGGAWEREPPPPDRAAARDDLRRPRPPPVASADARPAPAELRRLDERAAGGDGRGPLRRGGHYPDESPRARATPDAPRRAERDAPPPRSGSATPRDSRPPPEERRAPRDRRASSREHDVAARAPQAPDGARAPRDARDADPRAALDAPLRDGAAARDDAAWRPAAEPAQQLAPAAAAVAPPRFSIRFVSGGSRMSDSKRFAPNQHPLRKDNEDAFLLGNYCFAVADGYEGKPNPRNAEMFSSAQFATELVANAVGMMGNALQDYMLSGGANPLVEPALVLQRAAASAAASGAAAVLLGALDSLQNRLRIAKLGDVGFVVLRSPVEGTPRDLEQDLEVISAWRPYMIKDHNASFHSSKLCCSTDLADVVHPASWQRDCYNADIELKPSDIVIAGTDGLFDALHMFKRSGLETRRFIRSKYFNEQCDPGLLAEGLLRMARGVVLASKDKPPEEIDTPFMNEARARGESDKFQHMPEDDIAVVVSYVLASPEARLPMMVA